MVPRDERRARHLGSPFAFADGRRDVNFIPCAGAKRLVTPPAASSGTALAAGAAAARVAALGAYERRERYLDSVHAEGTPPPRRWKSPIPRGVPAFASTPRKTSIINIYIGRIPGSSSTAARGVSRRRPTFPPALFPPAGRLILLIPGGDWGAATAPGWGGMPGEGAGAVPRRRPRERTGPAAVAAAVGRSRVPTGRIPVFPRSLPRE